eukprot:3271957-Pyramimonas_sp.AAC.1
MALALALLDAVMAAPMAADLVLSIPCALIFTMSHCSAASHMVRHSCWLQSVLLQAARPADGAAEAAALAAWMHVTYSGRALDEAGLHPHPRAGWRHLRRRMLTCVLDLLAHVVLGLLWTNLRDAQEALRLL